MEPSQLPLRNIHLPDPIGWWPVAPGWWILMAMAVLLIVFSSWWWRRMRRFAIKKYAVREFFRLKNDPNLTSQQRIEILSALLRRICISIYPREQVASLTGQDWLNFLNRQLNDGRFTEGAGKLLVEAPYRKDMDCDLTALLRICEDWLEALPPGNR